MADIYVRSAAGGTNAGTSWGNAYTSFTSAINTANHAAGDTIWIAHDHNEALIASAQTWASDGTAASPLRIICADDTANYASTSHSAPTTLAQMTNYMGTSGSNSLSLSVGHTFWYGVKLQCGDAAGSANLQIISADTAASAQWFDNSVLRIGGSSSANAIRIGAADSSMTSSAQYVDWKNTSVRFAAAGQSILPRGGRFVWSDTPGSALDSAGTIPTALFKPSAAIGPHGTVLVDGVNLSSLTTALVDQSISASIQYQFANVEIGTGCVITTGTHPTFAGADVMAINVDSGDTNYKMHKEGYAGKVTVSSAIYVTTGGARAPHNTSDVPLSWEVAASANAKIYHPCFTPWIEIFNSTTGSRTVTVEAARDGSATALKDTEMWLEVEYLGTTGETRGSYSSGRATVIAAGANLTTGSTTWTGLNATNTRYSLARTVTAEEQGVIRARVGVAADTTTNKVYVDPRITLS